MYVAVLADQYQNNPAPSLQGVESMIGCQAENMATFLFHYQDVVALFCQYMEALVFHQEGDVAS